MNFALGHLKIAWEQVRKRSQVAGIDGISPELLRGVINEELHRLQYLLTKEQYQASPAKGFFQPKKSGGRRLLGISTVRDRIVQRFILNAIYPTLESKFSDRCYAYRPGLGVRQAISDLSAIYTNQPVWVIKADISQFFDNLNWALLLTQLEKLDLPPVMLRLIEQQIKVGVMVKGYKLPWSKGVIQGGILSGALANLYLSDFDHKCVDRGLHLIRYGDDNVIPAQSFNEATEILNRVERWLKELCLTLHPNKTQIIAPEEEFKFLGYRFSVGRVIAPTRKQPSLPKKTQSSRSHLRSRPPRSCSIIKTKLAIKQVNPNYLWSEQMTTLYITEQGTYIKAKNRQLRIYYDNQLKLSIPVNRVSHIMIFGCCNLSQGVVKLALHRRIPIMFFSQKGHYYGRLQAEGMAEIDYLVKQVNLSQNAEVMLQQAKAIVHGKLHNSRVLLLRLNRKKKREVVINAVEKLAAMMSKTSMVESY